MAEHSQCSTRRRIGSDRVQIAFLLGATIALGLVGFGSFLIPATSKVSIAAAAAVILGYAVVGCAGWQFLGLDTRLIRSTAVAIGLTAAAVFVAEVTAEYVFLPLDNSRFGFVEFGLVFLLYAVAGFSVSLRGGDLKAGVKSAVSAALISSLLWYIVILATFYFFFGTARQGLVFQAEGDFDDFAHSGSNDFNSWIMEDFLGAGFFHLLLGPVIAAASGAAGGLVALGARWLRRTP